jgi:hypothetical protein
VGSEWLPFEFDGPGPQVSEKPGGLQTAPAGEEDFASILDRMRPPTAKGDVTPGEVWREAIRGGFSGDTLQTATMTTVERTMCLHATCHAGHTPFVRS